MTRWWWSVLVLCLSAARVGAAGGGESEEECNHENIFEAEHDRKHVALSLLGAIGGIFLVEALLRSVESSLREFQTGFDLLEKLYRELMIMGLISMTVLIAREVLGEELPDDWLLAFEFTHIFVFFVAITFVFEVGMIFMLSRKHRYEWHRFCELPAQNFLMEVNASQQTLWHRFTRAVFRMDFSNVSLAVRMIAIQFPRTHGLPDEFIFPKYLRKVLARGVSGCVEQSLLVWALLIANLFVWSVAKNYYGSNGVIVCYLVLITFSLLLTWLQVNVCGFFLAEFETGAEIKAIIAEHDHTKQHTPTAVGHLQAKRAEIVNTLSATPQTNIANMPFRRPSAFFQRRSSNAASGGSNAHDLKMFKHILSLPRTGEDMQAELRWRRWVVMFANALNPLVLIANAYFFGLFVMVRKERNLALASTAVVCGWLSVLVTVPYTLVLNALIDGVVNPNEMNMLSVLDYIEELNQLRSEMIDKLTNSSDLCVYLCDQNNVTQLLKSLDLNGDGKVTRCEFVRGLRKRGFLLSCRKAIRILRLVDWDHSGTIEVNEMRHMIAHEADYRLNIRIRAAFDEIAGARTDELDPSDLPQLLAKLEREYEDPRSTIPKVVNENGMIATSRVKKWYLSTCKNHMSRLGVSHSTIRGEFGVNTARDEEAIAEEQGGEEQEQGQPNVV